MKKSIVHLPFLFRESHFAILALLLISFQSSAQETLEEMSNSRTVILNTEETVISVEVLTTDSKLENVYENATYHWFSNNKINANRGGYDGQLLHGEYTVKLSSGELVVKGMYQNGLKNGAWSSWYQNGNKETSSNWVQGALNGSFLKWNEEGYLTSIYTYKEGWEEGEYSLYNSKGSMMEKGNMYKGQKHGSIKTYRDDGSLISEVDYREGKKHGWSRIFDENGVLSYKQRYKNGELIPKMEKDSEKTPMDWKFWKNEEKEKSTYKIEGA